jgi:hypothetical protein
MRTWILLCALALGSAGCAEPAKPVRLGPAGEAGRAGSAAPDGIAIDQDDVRSRTQEWLGGPFGSGSEPKTMRQIVSEIRLEDPGSRAALSRRIRGSVE